MRTINLAGSYRLRAEFLDVGPDRFREVLNHAEKKEPFGILRTSEHRKKHPNSFPYPWGTIKANIPCDVIVPLLENGLMEEPLEGLCANDKAWLCDLSWWFIKEFTVPEEFLEEDEVYLFIEMLDYKADIILNGIPAGHHENTFRPFEKDVKQYLKVGENQMIIRLTSGTEDYMIQDALTYYCCTDDGTKNQRAYLRKPQYTYGWDWCPSIPTCGIGGRVELLGRTGARVSSFRADTLKIGEKEALLELCFEIDKTNMACAEDGILTYRIYDGQEREIAVGSRELYLAGGLNFHSEKIEIKNPKLWWPNGYGEAYLYTVKASVLCREILNEMEPVRIGIRTVEIRQDKIDANQRRFDIVVNGVPVFCKGGNFVPPDSVYLRVTEQKYCQLTDEARNMHFTMLRVWGGGLYPPDIFYEYCSEKGILVMQDFMYACAFYPDRLGWFMHEAALEAEYQTRRLSHYPCLAVFTGNNEIAESWTDWWCGMLHSDYDQGRQIYHYMQPKVVKMNCPTIPYMPSCPYFGNFTEDIKNGKVDGMSDSSRWGKRANSPLCGDVHGWNYFLNDPGTRYTPDTVFETFDRFPARFLSEYGFYGPLSVEAMQKATGKKALSFEDPEWKLHGEKPEKREMILGAIEAMFCGTEDLSVEDYLLYGGITQGILYQELAEAMRIKPWGSGFLIWMFNDAWPETGWTVLDYYLNRKISYYYLKRAFQERRMILRTGSQGSELTILNEKPQELVTEITYGRCSFDGSKKTEHTLSIRISPHGKEKLLLDLAPEPGTDFAYALTADGQLEACTDLRPYYRRYELPEAKPDFRPVRLREGSGIELWTDVYVPCVYLKTDNEKQTYSDNYFPMLPGEKRVILLDGAYREIRVFSAEVRKG